MPKLHQYNGKEWVEIAKNGKDGQTPYIDIDQIIHEAAKQVPKPKDGRDGSPDTGLEIKDKLLSLSDKDKLKLSDLSDFKVFVDGIERSRLLPQSGITTTFFSLGGTVIGRAKNINFVNGSTLDVTLAGDTATITIPTGGSGGNPAPPDMAIQFNQGGVFGGTSDLTWDYTQNILTILGPNGSQFLFDDANQVISANTGLASLSLSAASGGSTFIGGGNGLTGYYADHTVETLTGKIQGNTLFFFDVNNDVYKLFDVNQTLAGIVLGVEPSNGQKAYFDNPGHDLKLGINTTSPAQNLHVEGTARITDDVTTTLTTLMGRDGSGDIGSITVGSGLDLTANVLTATGGGGTPASPDMSVQFNQGGSFGGTSDFLWDYGTNTLTIANAGDKTFLIDPANGLYQFGDIDFGNNGSNLTIDDVNLNATLIIGSVAQPFSSLELAANDRAILRVGNGQSIFQDMNILLDWTNNLIEINGKGNRTAILVDGISTVSMGDIDAGTTADIFTVDIGNSFAYYDNTAHDGKFGINTVTPAQNLHVVGVARITGTGSTATTLTGRDTNTDITNVTVGTGLSLSAGTLSATGTSSNGTPLAMSLAGSLTIPASTTAYNAIGAPTFNGTETNRQWVCTAAGTIKNLYVVTDSAQPGTGTLVVTLRKNAASQAVTLTISAGAAAGTFSDTTHTFAVAAGDLIDFQYVNNASGTSASIKSVGYLFV